MLYFDYKYPELSKKMEEFTCEWDNIKKKKKYIAHQKQGFWGF